MTSDRTGGGTFYFYRATGQDCLLIPQHKISTFGATITANIPNVSKVTCLINPPAVLRSEWPTTIQPTFILLYCCIFGSFVRRRYCSETASTCYPCSYRICWIWEGSKNIQSISTHCHMKQKVSWSFFVPQNILLYNLTSKCNWLQLSWCNQSPPNPSLSSVPCIFILFYPISAVFRQYHPHPTVLGDLFSSDAQPSLSGKGSGK